MITSRTVVVSDPLARANVVAVLAGPGAPDGVLSCIADGERVIIEFDERTGGDVIDALVTIARTFVPARVLAFGDLAEAAAVASRGLDEPQLDRTRIIETYLT